MAKSLRSRVLVPLTIILGLVMAPLVIFSLGVSPVDATLADYSGGHASSPACSGSLQAGTVVGIAPTHDDEGSGWRMIRASWWPVVMRRTLAG